MADILVIVDMQNDFCEDNGVLSNNKTIEVSDKVVKLLNSKKFDSVIVLMDTHDDDIYRYTTESRHLPVKHCIYGSDGWKIKRDVYDALYNQSNVLTIQKNSFAPDYNEFHLDKFDNTINFYVCGVCTDICVVSTALMLKANAIYSEVNLIKDCCAGTTPEKHFEAISVMSSCHVNIIESFENIIKK